MSLLKATPGSTWEVIHEGRGITREATAREDGTLEAENGDTFDADAWRTGTQVNAEDASGNAEADTEGDTQVNDEGATEESDNE